MEGFQKKYSRPLFTIIFRPKILFFVTYSILTGQTKVEFVIYWVLSPFVFQTVTARSSLYENKVLFTKPFQAFLSFKEKNFLLQSTYLDNLLLFLFFLFFWIFDIFQIRFDFDGVFFFFLQFLFQLFKFATLFLVSLPLEFFNPCSDAFNLFFAWNRWNIIE